MIDHLSFSRFAYAIMLSAAFAVPTVNAQRMTTTVVNDNFADGLSDAGPQQIGFFNTSSPSGLEQNADGSLGFVTGTSRREIHGLFAPQTLSLIGDELEVTFDFTTPASVDSGVGLEDFRFGLFNTGGQINPANGENLFAQDILASVASPNPILNTLPGFTGEIDNINAPGTDLGIRTHNVNDIPGAIFGIPNDFSSPSGILLNTIAGFDFIRGGTDDVIALGLNTDFTGRLLVELNTPGFLDVTVELLDASGASIDFLTDTLSVNDVPLTQVGVNTTTFDFLGFSASGGAFGSSNALGAADNGIDISNVTVNFSTVPEPGSATLLLSLGTLAFIRRRR